MQERPRHLKRNGRRYFYTIITSNFLIPLRRIIKKILQSCYSPEPAAHLRSYSTARNIILHPVSMGLDPEADTRNATPQSKTAHDDRNTA